MAGPPRKPTQHHIDTGSWRGKDRAKTEPALVHRIPEPPHWYAGEREFWDSAVESLKELRCVTLADREQLALLADALRDYSGACAEVQEHGAIGVSDKGGTYISAAASWKQMAYGRLKDCLDRFGMNPANRSKVVALSDPKGETVKLNAKKGRFADSD